MNNVEVYQILNTPTEQAINLSSIETLEGTSTLSINNEVSPSNIILTISK